MGAINNGRLSLRFPSLISTFYFYTEREISSTFGALTCIDNISIFVDNSIRWKSNDEKESLNAGGY